MDDQVDRRDGPVPDRISQTADDTWQHGGFCGDLLVHRKQGEQPTAGPREFKCGVRTIDTNTAVP